ncbi:YceI family protein [Paraflavitalea sp. CAU 1676]|uniref:YceI family protein n=1 Tax=Paraflavitalea sp. CAU 1676 TaxID=3032598 RepID=UPI0023DAD3F6|nr:YceI family protein [Paraflavitalea sp. CAU 1676]MDF2187334.1 YceI family protein [Paraflavitalea sp. CAU 1676]
MEETKKEAVWVIDPVHTRIRFDTKYLLLTPVSGWFTQFEGSVINTEDNFNGARAQLTIYTNSVYTGNEERDTHLRSADFFDTAKFPVITWKSDQVTVQNGKIEVTGSITIKGIEQPITLQAQHLGSTPDPMGNTKAGFAVDATLNRKDFNITWNQLIDKHGLLLSDEVVLHCDVQLLKLP